jgi:diacylglycerol O-acyltransferase
MHIGSLGIYDQSTAPGGVVTFKSILQMMEERLGLARSFTERLVHVPMGLDHPYWVSDPDFDLEYHVRHIVLPKPGDWRQLWIQVARLHPRPLDMDRPLWEFTVIEGLDNVEGVPAGSYAIVSKIHHSAIDGVWGKRSPPRCTTLSLKETHISTSPQFRRTRCRRVLRRPAGRRSTMCASRSGCRPC